MRLQPKIAIFVTAWVVAWLTDLFVHNIVLEKIHNDAIINFLLIFLDIILMALMSLIIVSVYSYRMYGVQKKIERASRIETMGLLAAGIAHDFNNLLMGISGNIEIAKEMIYKRNGEVIIDRSKEVVNVLNDSLQIVDKASKLTFRLRAFDSSALHTQRSNIIPIIENTLKVVLVGHNNIHIERNYSTDIYDVMIDLVQMEQVFQNLILNAIQAMETGGNLILSIKNDNYSKIKTAIKITIVDTGVGIPAKRIDKLYDLFFTTKSNGSGLGLSTSLEIIQKHNGLIEITSKEGVGTKVEVYLPAITN